MINEGFLIIYIIVILFKDIGFIVKVDMVLKNKFYYV